jgi:DNA replication and repair protein RecF
MIIERIDLNFFRNYTACSLTFNTRLNFIFGGNGNGKTNLLEAISVLSYTKSFLQASDSDCLKYGEYRFKLNGNFANKTAVKTKIQCEFNSITGKKKFIANSEQINRIIDHFGSLPLVIFSPQDMKLSYGLPADRRRNFDILLSQTRRMYFNDLRSYNRILRQKNALLKDNLISKKYSITELKKLISGWNDEMVIAGTNLMEERYIFESEFADYLTNSFNDITSGISAPLFKYSPDIIFDISQPFVKMDIYELFYSRLKDAEDKEIKRGYSIVGPHRDDWKFTITKNGNEFELKYFASQGEQKTYVIAIKFAEYNYLRTVNEGTTAGEPILLLDDIYSELDYDRIRQISKIISGFKQVFITTTNPDYIEVLYQFFRPDEVTKIKIFEGTAEYVN